MQTLLHFIVKYTHITYGGIDNCDKYAPFQQRWLTLHQQLLLN